MNTMHTTDLEQWINEHTVSHYEGYDITPSRGDRVVTSLSERFEERQGEYRAVEKEEGFPCNGNA